MPPRPPEIFEAVCISPWRSFGFVSKNGYSGPAEPVQPHRPWSDQKSCYLCPKPCIFRVLVGPVIVRLRFFLNGLTNLVLFLPLLIFLKGLESVSSSLSVGQTASSNFVLLESERHGEKQRFTFGRR